MDKLETLGLIGRLENRDFILKIKMAKLNKNSEQHNRPDAV